MLAGQILGAGLSDWIGLIGLCIGVAGLFYGWITNRQKKEISSLNERLSLQLKTITMDDVQIFSQDVVRFLKGWKPDVIYCPDLRAGFVGFFLAREIGIQVPILTGYIFSKDKPVVDCNVDNYYEVMETPRYHIMIERYIFKYIGKKILIVDEIAVTGEAIHAIKQLLNKNGAPEGSILSCVVVASVAADKSGRKPNFVWRLVENPEVIFPWGRWD
jgi:hypoxanthine phosphoribosyltransferase